MKFKKNKFKVIMFYIIAFVAISFTLWGILKLFFDDRDSKMFFVFGEIMLIASPIMFHKAFIGELNQSVTLSDNKIECNNFFVKGSLTNASFEYSQIKSIELKRTLFSRHLIIKVEGSENAPIVLNNQFENYSVLWKNICDKCREQNPDALIAVKTDR